MQELLERRDLSHPDGRPLYRYRLTEQEFNDLEGLMRREISTLSERYDLYHIACRPCFDACFVLYSAEWWRRRYAGRGFSWDPILSDLGANPSGWTADQRSTCVQRGFQKWGIRLIDNANLRFIGSVAVQGGLPLHLLSSGHGLTAIEQVLKRVNNLVLSGDSTTLGDIQMWVESQQGELPASYRQPVVFTLLADVVWIVSRLVYEVNLTADMDVQARITAFDDRIPSWRDLFPLPIEDQEAQGLIERLIGQKPPPPPAGLPLERVLGTSLDGSYVLHSNLVLPDTIKGNNLARLFGCEETDLPRSAELAMIAGDRKQATRLRRLAGGEVYRIQRKPLGFSGETAIREHILHLTAPDGRVWRAPVAKGAALDEGLPWIFVARDSAWLLFRQGGGAVSTTEALLVVPEPYTVSPEPESTNADRGSLESPPRRVSLVRGTVRVEDESGAAYRIRTGQAQADEESYGWQGDRLWLDFQSPSMVFKGAPRFYRENQSGIRAYVEEWNLDVRPIGQTCAHSTTGPVVVRYPATGEIKHREKMVLLPHNASLKVEPQDATSGKILFEKWGAVKVRVLSTGVEQKSQVSNNGIVLDLALRPGERTPERVEVELFWAHTVTPVRLTVPFPAKGVRAFDGAGNELPNGSLISTQRVMGTRIVVLFGQEHTPVALDLVGSGGHGGRRFKLQSLPGAAGIEVRLQDYDSDIQHLLSCDDRPEAKVRVTLDIFGQEYFRLDLARYSAMLEHRDGNLLLNRIDGGNLDCGALGSLPVMALRLERPGDDSTPILFCTCNGEDSGHWQFAPETREPGTWLIYPGPDSALPFRPLFLPVEGELNADTPLARAIGISDSFEREAALDQVIKLMAQNFMESSWLEVEQLAGQIGHLPLATFDLWRRFARASSGMAGLAFRFGNLPGGFLDRFAQELPFAWEAIPFAAWKQAMGRLEYQCEKDFGADAGSHIFRNHLRSRINELSAKHGAITFLLGIASANQDPSAAQQVNGLRYIGTQAPQMLFDGPNCLMMRLLQLHADDQYPEDANEMIDHARSQPELASYLHPPQLPEFREGIINLPLLLAAQAAMDQTDIWFEDRTRIHILRTCRAFDPEWFDEAYNLTIARCLANGLLDD
jgi:hypothetical protein